MAVYKNALQVRDGIESAKFAPQADEAHRLIDKRVRIDPVINKMLNQAGDASIVFRANQNKPLRLCNFVQIGLEGGGGCFGIRVFHNVLKRDVFQV